MKNSIFSKCNPELEGTITYKGLDLEYKCQVVLGAKATQWEPETDPEIDGLYLYLADTNQEKDIVDHFTSEDIKEIEQLIWIQEG